MLPTTVIGYWLRVSQDKLAVLQDAAHDIFVLQKDNCIFDDAKGMVWEESFGYSHPSTSWIGAKEGNPLMFTSRRCLTWLQEKTDVYCFVYGPTHIINDGIVGQLNRFAHVRNEACSRFERTEIDLKCLAHFAIRQSSLLAAHLIKTENNLTTMIGYSVFRCKQLAPSLRLEGKLQEQLESYEICDCCVKWGDWECEIRPSWLDIESDQFSDGENIRKILDGAFAFSSLFLEKLFAAGIIP